MKVCIRKSLIVPVLAVFLTGTPAVTQAATYQYDTFACRFFNIVLKPFGGCQQEQEQSPAPSSTPVVSLPAPTAKIVPTPNPAPSDNLPAATSSQDTATPATNNITNEYITVQSSGVSESQLNARLALYALRSHSHTSNTDTNSPSTIQVELDRLEALLDDRRLRQTDRVYDSISDSRSSITSGGTLTDTTLSGALTLPDITTNLLLYANSSGVLSAATGLNITNNSLTIGTTTAHEKLTVDGPVYLGSNTPASTQNRLYNTSGSLYWNGSVVAGASVGSCNTNGTDVYRLTGNVGIGTSTPQSKLSVIGDGYFSGNVGIGTTAPGAKLHVSETSGQVAIFGNIAASSLTANPVNVSFGSTFGSNTPGSTGNLKWDLFTSASSGSRYGIGMSTLLMEFQAGQFGEHAFFVNDGTEALRIRANGNVGIGTTAPETLLEISSASPILRVTNSEEKVTWTPGDKVGALEFYVADTSNNFPAVGGAIEAINTIGTGFSPRVGLRFLVNNNVVTANEAMRITSSGDVGIGTTAPTSKLDVLVADGDNVPGLTVTQNDTTNNPVGQSIVNAGTGNGLFIDQNGNGTALSIDSEATSADVITVSNEGTGRTLEIDSNATNLLTQAVYINDASTQGGNNTMRIDSSRNGGSTVSALELRQAGSASGLRIDQNGNGAALVIDSDASSADVVVIDNAGTGDSIQVNTSDFVVDDEGNVGIGTINPSLFKLQVAGNVGPNADNTYTLGAIGSDWECVYYEGGSLGTCASDRNLKTNITDLTYNEADRTTLEKLSRLQVRSFEYKEARGDAYNGLIAQEVREAGLDALVTERPNGYLAVKYGDLQWVIVEAIQEMWSKVQEYFTRTEQLEEEVETLKTRLEALESKDSNTSAGSADSDESAASEDEPEENLDDEPASDASTDDEDTEDTATTTPSTNATSTATTTPPGIDSDPVGSDDPTATTTPELPEGTDPEPDPVVTEPPVAEPEVPEPTAEEPTIAEPSATSSSE